MICGCLCTEGSALPTSGPFRESAHPAKTAAGLRTAPPNESGIAGCCAVNTCASGLPAYKCDLLRRPTVFRLEVACCRAAARTAAGLAGCVFEGLVNMGLTCPMAAPREPVSGDRDLDPEFVLD